MDFSQWNPGASFVNRPRGTVLDHLWFVVAVDPTDRVLVANITSPKEGCDKTCVVTVGEHEFLKYDSYVYYRGANISTRQALNEAYKANLFYKIWPPCSPALLQRIRVGFGVSDFAEPDHWDFVQNNP